jgi:ribosomal protein L11 methyltransferase
MTANGAVPEVANQSDPGWATMWMDRFAPLPVGRRLLIVPPWNTAVNSERTRLVIQPGQGFGTGHHPTTAGALCTIENLCGTAPPTEALDVGTGSGVLAIAMRLYGVKHVVAIDNDPAALENARENAGLNLIHAVRFSSARLKSFRRRFDLVTANILSSTLIAMAPDLIRLVKPGGHLILGGILARERGAVLNHYRPKMRLIRSRIDRGWATLVMER